MLSNETHDVNKFNPPRERPRNARVISAQELGTMSKNNFKNITLDRTPIYEIHSLTLMISCLRVTLELILRQDLI